MTMVADGFKDDDFHPARRSREERDAFLDAWNDLDRMLQKGEITREQHRERRKALVETFERSA